MKEEYKIENKWSRELINKNNGKNAVGFYAFIIKNTLQNIDLIVWV